MIKNMSGSKSISTGSISRRKFLKSASSGLAIAAFPGLGYSFIRKIKRDKMILSFYMDDTNPFDAKAEAYKVFLEYCKSNGIKGEASAILAWNGKSMVQSPDDNQSLFL
jgi:hypothetical protein